MEPIRIILPVHLTRPTTQLRSPVLRAGRGVYQVEALSAIIVGGAWFPLTLQGKPITIASGHTLEVHRRYISGIRLRLIEWAPIEGQKASAEDLLPLFESRITSLAEAAMHALATME